MDQTSSVCRQRCTDGQRKAVCRDLRRAWTWEVRFALSVQKGAKVDTESSLYHQAQAQNQEEFHNSKCKTGLIDPQEVFLSKQEERSYFISQCTSLIYKFKIFRSKYVGLHLYSFTQLQILGQADVCDYPGSPMYQAVSSLPSHLDLRSFFPKLSHLSPLFQPGTFPQVLLQVNYSTLGNKLRTFLTHHIHQASSAFSFIPLASPPVRTLPSSLVSIFTSVVQVVSMQFEGTGLTNIHFPLKIVFRIMFPIFRKILLTLGTLSIPTRS